MKHLLALMVGLLVASGAVAESRDGPAPAVAKPVGTAQSGPEQAGRPSGPAAQAGMASPSSEGVVHRDVAARSGVATGAGAAAGAAAVAAPAVPGANVLSSATGQRAVNNPGVKGTVAPRGAAKATCGIREECDDGNDRVSSGTQRAAAGAAKPSCSSTDPNAACGDMKSVKCPDGTCASADTAKK